MLKTIYVAYSICDAWISIIHMIAYVGLIEYKILILFVVWCLTLSYGFQITTHPCRTCNTLYFELWVVRLTPVRTWLSLRLFEIMNKDKNHLEFELKLNHIICWDVTLKQKKRIAIQIFFYQYILEETFIEKLISRNAEVLSSKECHPFLHCPTCKEFIQQSFRSF